MTNKAIDQLAPRTISGAPKATFRLSEHPTLISLFSIAIVILLWAIAPYAGWLNPLFFPTIPELLKAFSTLWQQGYLDVTLGQHIEASLYRVLAALFFALITALPLGILMGLNKIAKAVVDPFIDFYRPIPPLAYLPLIVIWFGIGEVSKVLLIYLAIFAPLVIATSEAVRRVDRNRIQVVRCLGAGYGQVVRLVILPAILPDIITGLRIALGVGWSTLVAAELIAANQGLGFMVESAAQFLSTEVVVAGIIIIAFIALIIEFGLRQVQKHFVSWSLHDAQS
ncbi:ABC transporter permease subunit [Tatumella citrea]|uniref:Taurine ABC transporter permease n=1 Tax=Tatumella citrea TaxID=53336 RepID=A0A1Y0LLV3_TATCI|nr:ABC transporter permease subunit [Tatumella citrea]ARU95004.1 taurine ABC transporter permease [Tatumella citrea]ARU99042.1 taurine ABC transporter permease [Tatumella citrea]